MSEVEKEIEVKYFNVENTSIRLVHLGSVIIPPEKVVAVPDDPEGINRQTVSSSEYLEETDKEANWNSEENSEIEVEVKSKPSKNSTQSKQSTQSKTATGNGWTPKP